MKSLNQFEGHKEIFRDPAVLPPFFETNLVDPARVVKVFENDPQAEIRIFYYQYLKLCFELQNVNYDLYIRKIEEIINNPNFQFIFDRTDDPSIFNDTQAKSLIMEFFGVLGEGNMNVLQSLVKYPVLDKIFIHFFRSLLILSQITDSVNSYIQRDQLLDFLCKTFEVEAEIHGQCIRYIDTDIFIYEESKYAVYMAYMDYENYNNSLEQSPQVNQSVQQPTYAPPETKAPQIESFSYGNQVQQAAAPYKPESKRETLAKDSYIAGEFLDFTSNVEALTSKAKVTLKQSGMDQPTVQPKVEAPKSVLVEPKLTPAPIKETPKSVIQELKPVVSPDIYRNVNSSIVEVKSVPSSIQQSVFKPEVKNYWQQPVQPVQNPLQMAQTAQTIYQSSSNSSNQYTSNQYSSNFSSITQPALQPLKSSPQPPPTKDSTFNQTSPQLYPNNSTKPASNDIFYNPKVDNPAYNKAAYNSPKFEDAPKDLKSVTTKGVPSKKKPFGLNVSEQFTNSQVSKHMAEPHRTNVETMKTRARNFRSSLSNLIK